jgi:hypothetical protein
MNTYNRVIRFQKYDPLASPAWRWELANRLVDDKADCRKCKDPAVRAATALVERLTAEEPGGGPVCRRRAVAPSLEAAHRIYRDGGLRRSELEARILANQPIAEIADRCHVSADTISSFEELFFAVRPHLQSWGWICAMVIGDGLRRGFANDELGALWRAFGYFGGPFVLDALVDAFYEVWRPREPATIGVYFQDDSPAPLGMQAAIAVHSIPINEATNRAFMATHLQLLKIQATMSAAEAESARDDLKRSMIQLWRSAQLAEPRTFRSAETKQPASTGHPAADLAYPDCGDTAACAVHETWANSLN